MSKRLFKEEQKFGHPWLWLVFFPILGLIIFIASDFGESGIFKRDEEDGFLGLIVLGSFFLILMVGLTTLFYKMKLITIIKPDGIYYKYPPTISKECFISKAEVSKFEIRKYNPAREYGGHGAKKGKRKYGKAYTVSGRTGLQLYLTNGQKILIGTHRKEAIMYAMDKMMN